MKLVRNHYFCGEYLSSILIPRINLRRVFETSAISTHTPMYGITVNSIGIHLRKLLLSAVVKTVLF